MVPGRNFCRRLLSAFYYATTAMGSYIIPKDLSTLRYFVKSLALTNWATDPVFFILIKLVRAQNSRRSVINDHDCSRTTSMPRRPAEFSLYIQGPSGIISELSLVLSHLFNLSSALLVKPRVKLLFPNKSIALVKTEGRDLSSRPEEAGTKSAAVLDDWKIEEGGECIIPR